MKLSLFTTEKEGEGGNPRTHNQAYPYTFIPPFSLFFLRTALHPRYKRQAARYKFIDVCSAGSDVCGSVGASAGGAVKGWVPFSLLLLNTHGNQCCAQYTNGVCQNMFSRNCVFDVFTPYVKSTWKKESRLHSNRTPIGARHRVTNILI